VAASGGGRRSIDSGAAGAAPSKGAPRGAYTPAMTTTARSAPAPTAPARAVEGETPITRGDRKLRTRAHLLAAALQLMGEGRGFGALSLREITRVAGVVPASFYRHFRDLDELGLALVEESGVTLRRLLREARRTGLPPRDILRRSVQIFRDYIHEHRLHFMFVAGERSGGSALIRAAVRAEERHFIDEMAHDLRQFGLMPDLSTPTLQMACGLVVTTMMNAATDFLDLPPKQPQLEREVTENFIRQLRLIFLGARAWRE
jgi:AcrR family transcriptional regulator